MKLRRLERLVERHIAPAFPELKLSRDLLVRFDGDPIVRGFVFDRSQMHGSIVRLDVFAQPLFVPAEGIFLSVATTLGEFVFDEDDATDAAVMTEMLALAETDGRSFLSSVSDCASLAQVVLEMPPDRMDDRLGAEIRAYCLLWTGRIGDAARELDELAENLRDFEVDWEFDALNRVKEVRQALRRSEAEARELLSAWAQGTTRALGLPR